jgi:general secretion pathway protein I
MCGSTNRPASRGAAGDRRTRGFTLLEVLIAFAILAVAMGAILQSFSQGLRSMSVAEKYTEATLLAQTKLAEVGSVIPLEAGEYGGDFESELVRNGGTEFVWRVTIEPYEGEEGLGGELPDLQIFQVAVEVGWNETYPARLVTLRTRREEP